jgi:hypothetical protein
MNTRLRYRLERLEAQARQARRSVIRIGIFKELPYNFVGERHIAEIAPGAPGRPAGATYSFEERPGPAPPGTHLDPGRTYISEADARL